MAITISNSNGSIEVNYNSTPVKIETANKGTSFCSVFGDFLTIHRPSNPAGDIKLLWSDVTGATSASNLLSIVNGYFSQVGTQSYIFQPTAPTTAFAVPFTANATNVFIYVDDIPNTTLVGWTFPGGVPTFAAGIGAGSIVRIDRLS
jgi:hypothetical protein